MLFYKAITMNSDKQLLINLKLILILIFALYIVLIPHFQYLLPIHMDEWNHLTYAQALMDSGSINVTEPYYGQWTEISPETGYHVFIAIIQTITGIQLFAMPLFLPGIIFIITVLAVYCFARRMGFGLESAFLTCLIPTSIGLLGPDFMVPAALGLLFITLSLLVAFYYKGYGSYIILFIFLSFLFFAHSPTAICLIIVLLPHMMINLKKDPKQSIGIAVSIFAPALISLPILLPLIMDTAAQLHIEQAFPKYVGFPVLLHDYGYIPLALSLVGVLFLLMKRGSKGVAVVTGLFALLIMLIIFIRFHYGIDLLYLRGLLYMLLLLSIIGGAGLLWIRNIFVRKVQAGTVLTGLIIIVILAISMPVRWDIPYYHMIDYKDFRAFTWIRENIPENNNKALIDPWKATAFTATAGKTVYHRIFKYQNFIDNIAYEILENYCIDMNFFTDNIISIIYSEIACKNNNFIHLYNNLYILNNNTIGFSDNNLLKNPGFSDLRYDDMPDEWWEWSENTEPDFIFPGRGRNGGPCVSIEMYDKNHCEQGQYAIWNQNVDVISGKSYLIGGWIKTEDIVGNAGAIIVPHWKTSDKLLISATEFMDFVQGTHDWQYFEGVVTAPEGASICTFCCMMSNCTGKAWFDDVVFTEK